MKKIILLSTLSAWSFGVFAVDVSGMQALVFVNDSNDYIRGSFRENSNCNDSGHVTGKLSLDPPGEATIPNYDERKMYYFTLPSDGHDYRCVSLNDNDKNDDIFLGYNNHGEYGIVYAAGSRDDDVGGIVTFSSSTDYSASLCYQEDTDGIDGNDDKYVWPSYENDTLTIHITDSAPPSSLGKCAH
ncbi:hypothetical protein V9N52_004215 [Vibrio navarrensis]